MTDATFAGTVPAIIRTDDHRYIYGGVEYPGVTSALGVLDKSGALMAWAAKETALATLAIHDAPGIDVLLESVGREGVIKAVTSRANWQRDEAAKLGSAVHRMAEGVNLGGDIDPMVDDTAHAYARRYATWWNASGWKLRLAEAMVIAPADPPAHQGWGGTFDLLCYDRDGRTVLADIKTGKGVYREAILQLAAYGMARYVQPSGSLETYPMPAIDRYAVIHVTRDGVREVELSIGSMEWNAWLSILDVYRWTQTVKGRL